MAQIAVSGQEQAVGAVDSKTAARPYPPSWVDRLADWVQGLPGPAWVFYLGVGLVLAIGRSIVGWSDGNYSAGTFFPAHILVASTGAYIVFIVHYLDAGAGAAIDAFRPVLDTGPEETQDAGYERLRYRLTTMPARPVLLWSLAGFLFGVVNQHLFIPETQLQSLKLYTTPAAFVVDSVMAGLTWMMFTMLIYHTIRQLGLVSGIYTQHTNVNIFETGPLYALSRVTAMTAGAILFATYIYSLVWGNWQNPSAADATVVMSVSLLALATFVWPLWGAHHLLQQEKTRGKSEVARRMKAVTDKLHQRVDANNMQGMDALKDALDGLVVERDIVDKVSTWPWEPETVRAVATALLLPVVIWVITRVLERLGF